MLREALRRVLWLVPALVAFTLTAFWFVSESFRRSSSIDDATPRFFNPNPLDARKRALAAADEIGARGSNADSVRELSEMGGAALPHVLPYLDALGPEQRVRVALALAPIAERMALGAAEDYASRERAVLFWTRFWQDHSIDFRPIVVKRAVRRAAERPTAQRRAEVLAFDTFALPELMDALSAATEDHDIVRVERVAGLAATITDKPWGISIRATASERRELVRRWQRWWSENRHRYVAFQGIDQVLAMVRETQYGRWAWRTARGGAAHAGGEAGVFEALLDRGRVTLGLLLAAGVGGLFGGAALTLFSARRRRVVDPLFTVLLAVAISVPTVALALWAPSGLAAAATIMALVATAHVYLYERAALDDALDAPFVLAERSLGLSPLRILWRAQRRSCAAAISHVAAALPLLATAAFVLEHAFGLRGVGPATTDAVRAGNVAWLMSVAAVMAMLSGLSQIGADVLLKLADPRMRLLSRRGAA